MKLKHFKHVKDTNSSSVYEGDLYIARLKDGNGFAHPPKDYIGELDSNGFAPFDILKVTNKKTGKSSSTRVFQDDPIKDLDDDYDVKIQFKKIWNKID